MKCCVKYEKGHRKFPVEAAQIGGELQAGCCFYNHLSPRSLNYTFRIFHAVSSKACGGRTAGLFGQVGDGVKNKQGSTFCLMFQGIKKPKSIISVLLPTYSTSGFSIVRSTRQPQTHRKENAEATPHVLGGNLFHRSGCSMRHAGNNKSSRPGLGAIRKQS